MSVINREKFFEYWNKRCQSSVYLSQGEVVSFLFSLSKLQLMFHMDDPASTVSCFTKLEAAALDTCIVPKLRIAYLPDYHGDIHEVSLACLNYGIRNNLIDPTFVYPKWGVHFEGDEDPNLYFAYLQPETWNGWARPLFEEFMMRKFLKGTNHVSFEYIKPVVEVPGFFRVFNKNTNEVLGYMPKKILTTQGICHVYEPDGFTFDVGDCLEAYPLNWKGYV